MSQEFFKQAGNVLIIYAAVVATVSVIVHSRVRWWQTQMGRHLMAYMGVMAAVLVLGVIRTFIGQLWWFELIRFIVFLGVPAVMTHRLWLQVKAQRETAHTGWHPTVDDGKQS